jgi:large subunit ribosomal protein L29
MASVGELREMKSEDLLARVGDLRHQIFEMKSKHNTGVLDSTADLMKTKREIAQCMTLIREQELGLKRVAKAAPKPRAKPAAAEGKKMKARRRPRRRRSRKRRRSKRWSAASKRPALAWSFRTR